jgi:iron complex transport system substrate-binding protein
MLPPDSGDRSLSRRQFVAGGLGALVSVPLLLAACGGDDEAAPAADTEPAAAGATTTAAAEEPSGPWEFTDDRHVTVSLPAPPERLVIAQDSMAALLAFGIRPVATFGNQPLSENDQFVADEVTGIESVGEAYGEINLEGLAALAPDLIITSVWPGQGNVAGGFTDDAHEEKGLQIAPIVTINAQVPYTDMMGRYRDLAAALGADLEAPEIVEMEDALTAAFANLRAAAEAKPGVRVLAISPTADLLYVAAPGQFADLMEYQAAGVDLITPTGDTSDFGGLWEDLSWENADKYPADVILTDGRPFALSAADLAKQPTWSGLPAVEGDQVGKWYVGTTYRPSFFIEQVEAVAAVIESAEDVVAE